MIPKRRKAPKMGLRKETVVRCPAHLKWVRGFACAVAECDRFTLRVQACHVRTGTDGSLSKKPGDQWTIPLCAVHHAAQHSLGEAEFERLYGLDMKKIAEELARKSPHRVKWQTPPSKAETDQGE